MWAWAETDAKHFAKGYRYIYLMAVDTDFFFLEWNNDTRDGESEKRIKFNTTKLDLYVYHCRYISDSNVNLKRVMIVDNVKYIVRNVHCTNRKIYSLIYLSTSHMCADMMKSVS